MLATRVQFVLCFFLCVLNLKAQQELVQSQYMNNQLLINPAYAGTRNALTTNFFAKRQWAGIEGAPTFYGMSIHTPLNKSMASIGLIVRSDVMGPLNQSCIKAIYAYLVRIDNNTLLSFGLSANANSYSLNTTNLKKINKTDPQFAHDIDNKWKPNFGLGVFLYRPNLYVGISSPVLLEYNIRSGIEDMNEVKKMSRTLFFTAGAVLPVNRKTLIKPSFAVFNTNHYGMNYDINTQLIFDNAIWFGISHRLNVSYTASLGFTMEGGFSMVYTYEIPSKSLTGNPGGHEIHFVIDYNGWYRKTRKRKFYKKRNIPESTIKSMRYF